MFPSGILDLILDPMVSYNKFKLSAYLRSVFITERTRDWAEIRVSRDFETSFPFAFCGEEPKIEAKEEAISGTGV